MRDVVVIGAGPAGLAVGAACADVGLDVVCVADARRGWPNNYGVWLDELAEVGLERFAKHTWQTATVVLDERQHVLERPYAQVDNEALRGHFEARVEVQIGTVERVEDVDARVVVDATGHRPAFIQRPAENPGWQAAIGWLATVDQWPFPLDQMRLMDFSRGGDPPTFLYAMPFGPNRVFVEETSLCARPAMDFERLSERLRERLAHLGVTVREIHATERCLIPMGLPLPERGPAVPFGGAASMVHPATGYMIAQVLRTAPQVAQAIKAGGDPWAAVWPRERVRTRALYAFGMEVLLGMDQAELRHFFDAFFHAPNPARDRYLAGTASMSEATATMRAVFARLPNRLRLRLIGRSFSPDGMRMLRALLG